MTSSRRPGLVRVDDQCGAAPDPELLSQLERVAAAALKAAGGPAPSRSRIEVTLVSDDTLREMSNRYLGVDEYTDVMSFSLLEGELPPSGGGPRRMLLGDVVISVDRAREQAQEYGHSLAAELCLLLAHGVLHLLGYDDDEPEARTAMRRLEKAALDAVGLSVAMAHQTGQ